MNAGSPNALKIASTGSGGTELTERAQNRLDGLGMNAGSPAALKAAFASLSGGRLEPDLLPGQLQALGRPCDGDYFFARSILIAFSPCFFPAVASKPATSSSATNR